LEVPKEYPHADKILENLLLNHESIIIQLRKDLETCEQFRDAGTADFLTAVMEKHENMAWMLRSFIELQNH
jgi:starvation-inducible DNA-binding protein